MSEQSEQPRQNNRLFVVNTVENHDKKRIKKISNKLFDLSIAEILIACSSKTINIGKMLRDVHFGLPHDVFANSMISLIDDPDSDVSFIEGVKGAYENTQDLFRIDERTSLIVPLENIVVVHHLETHEILSGFYEIGGGVQIGPKPDAIWPTPHSNG